MCRNFVFAFVLFVALLAFTLGGCGGRSHNDGWSPALTGAVTRTIKEADQNR